MEDLETRIGRDDFMIDLSRTPPGGEGARIQVKSSVREKIEGIYLGPYTNFTPSM